jgi:hypothetical protein
MGYNDNDWARDMDDKKSITSFVFHIGDITFIWSLKKQSILILSTITCEVEYVATTKCVCHSIG